MEKKAFQARFRIFFSFPIFFPRLLFL